MLVDTEAGFDFPQLVISGNNILSVQIVCIMDQDSMKAIPLGCVFDPGLVNRNIASVGERQETTIPTTAEVRRLAAALELFLLLIDCLVALVCIVSDAGGRLGRDDPGPFVLNDLVPPLFTLVVGAVPRPRLGPFLAKGPGSQDRRGGFHAVTEGIRKALVAQHLLIVFAEHAGIHHNHNPGDIETLFQRLKGHRQRMALPYIAREQLIPTG